jgi:hypothetical protein
MTKIAPIGALGGRRNDMPQNFRPWSAAIATTAVLIAAASVLRVDAQAPGDRPARIQGKPNLSGIWQALNEANWDLQAHEARPGPPQFGALFSEPAGIGVVDGNEIPYKAEALAKKKENFANRWTQDPEAKCYMPGVPRATYQPFPFQIIQGTDTILIAYPFASASRIVHLKDVGESPADSWMGWSRARWEGDTLVVNVTNLLEDTWFDRAGNFHSDALRVTERYTPSGDNAIQYEATIDDANVFARPWTIRMPLYRRLEKNAQVLEFKCVPFAEELLYGHLKKPGS